MFAQNIHLICVGSFFFLRGIHPLKIVLMRLLSLIKLPVFPLVLKNLRSSSETDDGRIETNSRARIIASIKQPAKSSGYYCHSPQTWQSEMQ